MKIIPQSHEWITPLNRDVTMQRIERIARTCYQSEDAIKPGSDSKMVAMLCKNHHYAMIEHISLTIKFITDRGVANEIVRHRIGSYARNPPATAITTKISSAMKSQLLTMAIPAGNAFPGKTIVALLKQAIVTC